MTDFYIPAGLMPLIEEYERGHEDASDDELAEIVLHGISLMEGDPNKVNASQVQPVLLCLAAQQVLLKRHDETYVNNLVAYGTPNPSKFDVQQRKLQTEN